jgi:Zn-dependent protease
MTGSNSGNFVIGHVWGVPIQINLSTFLILGIVTWSLADGILPAQNPEMSTADRWLTGLLTALIFFGSILFHELAHAWEARRNGIPVQSITLYIFGGIAQLSGKPKSPGAEFRIAAIGPASSLLLAAVFLGLNQVVGDRGNLGAATQWLGNINLILALFNLLPGYPLDGGRILESIVWGITKKQETGVRVAGTTGQIIAYGLMALGAFIAFQGNVFSGVWLVMIGFILHNAASAEKRAFLQRGQLSGLSVAQVMGIVREQEVPAGMTLQELVERNILGQGQGSFIVTAAGNPVGVLSLRDVARTPRTDWQRLTTGDAMTPLGSLPRVAPADELLDALQLMDANELLYLPVFDNGNLSGLLTRDEVIHYLSQRRQTAA